ncbi:hypothetical protein IU485_28390 [Nocardia cyriacigeorgica]|uniref:hypothetical protein n=1 Tax=Nocardia cyriacigeorgica TaxID=135487 RepID=UPI001895A533|nr:hypothetical protein [Nocardia cyriacigeorgica]MBF6085293.1 hypothetical protein [Nocardia cyriacigeorgica]
MTGTDETPTQCAHPGRAAARSTTATLVGLGPLIPLLVTQFGETRAAIVVAAALAGNAVVTRLLALPEVEAWLRHALPFLAAESPAGRHRRDTE